MDEESRVLLIIIVGFLLIIIFVGIIVILINWAEEKRPDAGEFCIKNGYYGTQMFNYDTGRCYNHNNQKRYFAWDGSNWRFEE